MPTAPTARRVLAGAILIALAVAGFHVGGTGSSGALAVGGVLVLLGLLAIAVALRGRAAGSPVGSAPTTAPSSPGLIHPWLSIHVAAAMLTLVVPHLHLLGLSVAIAVIAGIVLARRLNSGVVSRLGQGLTMLLLLGSWYALTAVAGDAPLGLAALHNAPYSEAFEVTVALPLCIAAWPLLGLFPFHQVRLGPLAPLAGAALLVRLAAVAVPNGLAHWQPLLYLLLVVATAHALVTRHDAESLAALAALGLLSGGETAGWCGIGLAAGVALIKGHSLMLAAGRVINARGQALVQALTFAGVLLLVPVLSGGLAAEAVYTALTAIGVALFLWR